MLSRLTIRRGYHVSRVPPLLKQNYSSITDYGSYRNQAFTHRLPETTALQLALLVALKSRLRLPEEYLLLTLLQALNMDRLGELATNFGLATLGQTFLSYYITEHLLTKMPRLPMTVHNQAVNAYMGSEVLSEIGLLWGIEADATSKLDKVLSGVPDAVQFGKLRYETEAEKKAPVEEGVYQLTKREQQVAKGNEFLSKKSEAYALAVKLIIGGLYTHCGEEAAKKFIHNHILSRKLPLQEMFQFSQPTREFVRVCEKEGMTEAVEIRLIAETGRKSAHPIYIAGAFCGVEKLGEGAGLSLREAKTRAVVNALLGYYLYSPITNDGEEVSLPSDEKYQWLGVIGLGDVAI